MLRLLRHITRWLKCKWQKALFKHLGVYIVFLWISVPAILFAQGEIIAHRGASSIAPENTIAAFVKAIKAGVDYIEVDLRLSKEDSIMVIHDETLDRTTDGSGNVNQLNYQQLKKLSAGYSDKFGSDFLNEKIPTLFEVLKLAKGKVFICIDIKNTSESPVLELVDKMDMKDAVVLMSYNVEKLKRIKLANHQIRTVLIKNMLTTIDIEVAKEAGAYGVSCAYISPAYLIKKAHDYGLVFWTGIISDPAKAERLFEQNVDAVFTNYPQLMTMSKEDELTIYPNPFSEEVTIQLKNPEKVLSVQIVDIRGAIVYQSKGPFPILLKWQPDNNIRKGVFFIYIMEKDKIFCDKIMFLH